MQTSIDHYEIERQFLAFMSDCGFPPPREGLKLDGKIHRFDIDGKKQVGAYQVWPEGKSFDGKPHGWVQDHREGGDKHYWQHKSNDANTASRKPRVPSADAKARVATKQAEDERKKREGLQLARADYEAAAPVNETSEHPYLVVKQVPAVGPLRCGVAHVGSKAHKNTLLIPCHDIAIGELVAVHRVFSWRDESGKFQKGWYSGTYGGAFTIAEDVKEGPVIVCEGIATGLSLYDATKYLTIASMDAGNLAKIAPAIRAKYPDRKIFIASDDDDAGKKAAKAALAAGFDGELCPPFLPEDDRPPRWNGEKPPTDWNDYVVMHGADVAGNVIEGLIEETLTTPEEKKARGELQRVRQYVSSINASDLMALEIPETRWAVEGFLPAGCSILSGGPKVGKSILASHVALAVATGGVALDKIRVEQGDVLYLALEDTKRRLQTRIRDSGFARLDLSRLELVMQIPRQHEGGLVYIEDWLSRHKDARLVIIDTLQKFRKQHTANGDRYAADYDAVGSIKSIADRFDVPVLIIHHTKKATDTDDWLNEISGTQGLAGAADTLLFLKRGRCQGTGVLRRTGRDVEEVELAMSLSGFTWRLEGDAEEFNIAAEKKQIIDHLKEFGSQTPKQIADCLDLKHNSTLKSRLQRMNKEGLISSGGGKYWCV